MWLIFGFKLARHWFRQDKGPLRHKTPVFVNAYCGMRAPCTKANLAITLVHLKAIEYSQISDNAE